MSSTARRASAARPRAARLQARIAWPRWKSGRMATVSAARSAASACSPVRKWASATKFIQHERLRVVRVEAKAALQRLDRLGGAPGEDARRAQHEVAQGEAGAQVDRPLCCGDRLLGLPDRVAVDGQRVERIGIAVGQPHGQAYGRRFLGEIGLAVLRPAEIHRAVEAADQPDVALGERRVGRDGPAEARARLPMVLAGDVMEVPLAAKDEVPGIHPLGGLALRPQRLRAHHAGLDRPDHAARRSRPAARTGPRARDRNGPPRDDARCPPRPAGR